MVSILPTENAQRSLADKIDARFERGADGKSVFYLDSKHRMGYVIDPPEREQALRKYALQRAMVDRILGPFAAAIVPIFGYGVGPRYPWAQALLYCFGPFAIWVFAGRLWLLLATAGLTKVNTTKLPKKLWAWLGGFAAVFIFISVYQPSSNLPLPPGAIAFYPDVGEPILMMIFGAVMTDILVENAGRMKQKFGAVRHGFSVGLCALFAIIGLVTAGYRLTKPVPHIIVMPLGLVCGADQVNWQDVSGISLSGVRMFSRFRHNEYAQLAIAPARLNPRRFSPSVYQRGYVSCEIDRTGAGYLAVYDAIEKAWKNRRT